MNEANLPSTWCGTFAQLVSLAGDAYTIIKSIDPNAQVLTPSTAGAGGLPWQWMASYLQAGGGAYADIGTFHGYTGGSNVSPYPYPDQNSTSGQSGCASGASNSICTGSVINKFNNLYLVYNSPGSGMAGKPIFDDEGSWGEVVDLETMVGTSDVDTAVTNPAVPVAWWVRYYLLQASLGVARVDWYQWGTTNSNDPPSDWGNILDTNGNVTAAGLAYEQVYNWLVGATPAGVCQADGDTWTCQYTRANGYQAIAVWNTSGADGTFAVGSQYTEYLDASGVTHAIVGGAVPIGLVPILVQTGAIPSN